MLSLLLPKLSSSPACITSKWIQSSAPFVTRAGGGRRQEDDRRQPPNVKVARVVSNFRPHGLFSPWSSPDRILGGHCSLLQGTFLNSRDRIQLSPHCRGILYHLSHQKACTLALIYSPAPATPVGVCWTLWAGFFMF